MSNLAYYLFTEQFPHATILSYLSAFDILNAAAACDYWKQGIMERYVDN